MYVCMAIPLDFSSFISLSAGYLSPTVTGKITRSPDLAAAMDGSDSEAAWFDSWRRVCMYVCMSTRECIYVCMNNYLDVLSPDVYGPALLLCPSYAILIHVDISLL